MKTKATAFVAESDVIEAATTPFFEDDEEDAGERETETRDDPASLSLRSEEGDVTGTETDGEGKTVEMKTREVSMAEINKLAEAKVSNMDLVYQVNGIHAHCWVKSCQWFIKKQYLSIVNHYAGH